MNANRATRVIEKRLREAGYRVVRENDGHGRYLLLFSRWATGRREGVDGAVVVGTKTGRVLRARAYFVPEDDDGEPENVVAEGYTSSLALVRRVCDQPAPASV